MSAQQEQPQQPTVRHIPIFVEGRSEPLVNTTPESQPSHHHPTQHHPSGLDSPSMEIPMPHENDYFRHGSIFDRARDIPVRTFGNSNFKTGFKREPSPGASRTSPFSDMGSHMRTEPPQQQTNANVPRGSSVPRQTQSPPTAPAANQSSSNSNSHYQQPRMPSQQPQPQPQPQQQPQQQEQQPPMMGHDQPDCRPKVPVKDDPITKIQKIQKDVLAIFDQVEHFKGGRDGKKDKTYVYLDEMLTQNLLKLDSIDAEDQPQIKSARREAIKSINTCIAVLEAKAEAGVFESANASSSSISKNNSSNGIDDPNGSEQSNANKSASNASIPHSSSNSSQQLQPNEDMKQ